MGLLMRDGRPGSGKGQGQVAGLNPPVTLPIRDRIPIRAAWSVIGTMTPQVGWVYASVSVSLGA
jgi:hypothetical protein